MLYLCIRICGDSFVNERQNYCELTWRITWSRDRLGESACTDQYLLRAFSSETTPISPVFGPGLRFQGMCGDDRTAGVEDGILSANLTSSKDCKHNATITNWLQMGQHCWAFRLTVSVTMLAAPVDLQVAAKSCKRFWRRHSLPASHGKGTTATLSSAAQVLQILGELASWRSEHSGR